MANFEIFEKQIFRYLLFYINGLDD